VTWDDFGAYVSSLSRNRRTAVRREIREFRDSGLTANCGDARALTDDLASLQASLRRRYGHPTDDGSIRRSYQRMREQLGAQVRVLTARDARSALAGFVLFFEAGGTYYIKSVGFDYERTGGTFCYFNLLFYELIDLAIRNRIRLINYGMESYQAKASRGCAITPLHAYLRFDSAGGDGLAELLGLRDLAVGRQVMAARAGHREREGSGPS
jgi:uncharacterized protein